MTTIHLTDAQRDTFAACSLIVIDGLRIEGYSPGASTPVTFIVPDDWRILTEPCERCGGHGYWYDITSTPRIRVDCPDCVGGRRVVTLTATCDDTRHGPHSTTLGRFTIPALARVIDGSDEWDGGGSVYDIAHLWWYDGSSTGGYQLTLDPLPHPGQFIARPERVE